MFSLSHRVEHATSPWRLVRRAYRCYLTRVGVEDVSEVNLRILARELIAQPDAIAKLVEWRYQCDEAPARDP